MSVEISDVSGPIVLNIWNEDILKNCAKSYENTWKINAKLTQWTYQPVSVSIFMWLYKGV